MHRFVIRCKTWYRYGIISELDDTKIKKIILIYEASKICKKYYGKVMDSNERDLKRTEIIRKIVTE